MQRKAIRKAIKSINIREKKNYMIYQLNFSPSRIFGPYYDSYCRNNEKWEQEMKDFILWYKEAKKEKNCNLLMEKQNQIITNFMTFKFENFKLLFTEKIEIQMITFLIKITNEGNFAFSIYDIKNQKHLLLDNIDKNDLKEFLIKKIIEFKKNYNGQIIFNFFHAFLDVDLTFIYDCIYRSNCYFFYFVPETNNFNFNDLNPRNNVELWRNWKIIRMRGIEDNITFEEKINKYFGFDSNEIKNFNTIESINDCISMYFPKYFKYLNLIKEKLNSIGFPILLFLSIQDWRFEFKRKNPYSLSLSFLFTPKSCNLKD